MQKKLKKLVRDYRVPASITAGLAGVFVALGDKYLKTGGRLALVLPRALLSGVAWEKSRRLLAQSYRVDYMIVSHEPDHWNFSENTDLSEVLVVATKKRSTDGNAERHRVTCVNLWHNPRNAIEALALSRLIAHSTPPVVPSKKATQGALQLRMDGLKFGEALAIPWPTFRQTSWNFPCAFAQSDLIRLHYPLLEGSLKLPGQQKGVRISPLPSGPNCRTGSGPARHL